MLSDKEKQHKKRIRREGRYTQDTKTKLADYNRNHKVIKDVLRLDFHPAVITAEIELFFLLVFDDSERVQKKVEFK